MTAGVITNANKDSDLQYTNQVCDFLTARNVIFTKNEYTNADFWVVLGGDGTMLRASHTAAILGVPMLGINLGTLGYLTAADTHDGINAISDMLDGKFVKESRLMLEVETNKPLLPNERLALNDVYISRGLGRLTAFSLYINELFIDNLRADGIIVSTPTGSTAYNLSAGGPILMPDGDMMVVTAVCPHTLHVRPWVISSRDEVRIAVSENNRSRCAENAAEARRFQLGSRIVFNRNDNLAADAGDVIYALDGEEGFTLPAGESITVRRSPYRAEIIKTSSPHFYEILRQKLR